MKDENPSIGDLARAWIQLQYAHANKQGTADLFWAHEELDKLCESAPDECLAAVLEILNLDSSDFIVANVGAGPLEDLLSRCGPQAIDSIERAASLNQTFRRALSGVWRSTLDKQIWARVQAAVAPTH